jgi:hypothetical protein
MMSSKVFISMFVYMFSMSKEASLISGVQVITFRSFIRSAGLLTLYAYGRGMYFCNIMVSNFTSFYAGDALQFTTGLMGEHSSTHVQP